MKTLKELKQMLANRCVQNLFEKDIELFESHILHELECNERIAFYPICHQHYSKFIKLLKQKGYVFKEGVCSGPTTIVLNLGEVEDEI